MFTPTLFGIACIAIVGSILLVRRYVWPKRLLKRRRLKRWNGKIGFHIAGEDEERYRKYLFGRRRNVISPQAAIDKILLCGTRPGLMPMIQAVRLYSPRFLQQQPLAYEAATCSRGVFLYFPEPIRCPLPDIEGEYVALEIDIAAWDCGVGHIKRFEIIWERTAVAVPTASTVSA